MVRGQVATIPSGTAVLLTTLSREQKNSMAILNPNDGVIYLRLNGPASLATTNWDWKLPSQSYGQYPGPWQSIGLWYQDQSGSNASGQINLYESDAELAIPSIVAIGRAAQVAGTQVDITQGTIPQNPPASTSRLWVDGTGHLHLLDSTGADKLVIDSTNLAANVQPLINATALGGDLYGTIPNGHVWAHTNPVQLDRTINVQWGSNTNMDRIVLWSDSNMYIDVTGICNIRPGGATALAVSSSGIAVTGVITDGQVNITNSLLWKNAAPTGTSDFGLYQHGLANYTRIANDNNIGLFTDAASGNGWAGGSATLMLDTSKNATFGGAITVPGLGQFNSTLQVSGGNAIQWNNGNSTSFEANYLYFRNNGYGFAFQHTNGSYAGVSLNSPALNVANGHITADTQNQGYGVQLRDGNVIMFRGASANYWICRSYDSRWDFQDASGNLRLSINQSWGGQTDFYGVNGSTNFRFFHGDTSWCGTQAANFQVQSDIRQKFEVLEESDADCLARLLTPAIPVITWDQQNAMPNSPSLRDIGFAAQDMQAAVPETVSVDDDGNYFLNYSNLTAVLWGALRLIESRLSKLETHHHDMGGNSPPSYTELSANVAP